jgi:hypothetical protein
LCENLHGEDTQWEMIFDIISDDYFINHVGNIFTEYGCAKDQTKVDTFLHATFTNDTLLAKEIASLMNFRGCFYFFMKKLNMLNQNLTDSLKVIEHFTDILSWRYLDGYYADSIIQHKNVIRIYRDSLMASVVIDWHRQTGKKCLVVTNYRHAFAVNGEAMSKNYKDSRRFIWNEAQYIYDQFPNKTVNVYLYGHKYNCIYNEPIQKGKWKAAFYHNKYQPVGFDLNETPFGNDEFDIFPTFGQKINLKWQDLFTGLIFNKPNECWTASDYPYKEYAAQQEYQWAVKNNLLVDTTKALKALEIYKIPEDNKLFWAYIHLYDYIDILLFVILSVITLIFAGISVVRRLIKT